MKAQIVGCIIATAAATAPAALAQTAAEISSLDWMQGLRVHTNENDSQVYEAFLGPVNGVITGTALTVRGADRAYTEYHKIGRNAEGVFGLDVANTANGMNWSFTPLKQIEPGKITFQNAEGSLTISYALGAGDIIDAKVERTTESSTSTQTWHFVPVADAG